jgi:hypothetical protein
LRQQSSHLAPQDALSDSRQLLHVFSCSKSTAARTVMRRLSNREYENTLATLFGRRVDTLGLTADFPKEKASEHIDTIGKSLVTSGFLSINISSPPIGSSRRASAGRRRRRSPGTSRQLRAIRGAVRAAQGRLQLQVISASTNSRTPTRGRAATAISRTFSKGVPVSGLYDIEVQAQAMHRDTHYDPAIFGIDFSEPFCSASCPATRPRTTSIIRRPSSRSSRSDVVPDDQPTWLKFRVWLEAGPDTALHLPERTRTNRAPPSCTDQQALRGRLPGPVRQAGVSRTHFERRQTPAHPHRRDQDRRPRRRARRQRGGSRGVWRAGLSGQAGARSTLCLWRPRVPAPARERRSRRHPENL